MAKLPIPICLFLAGAILSCQTRTIPQIQEVMTNPRKKIVIYQVMTRLFGNNNNTNKPYGTLEENGVGKFGDIDAKALKELHKFGVTHMWYTGVIEHAVITDYTAFGIKQDDADVVKGRAGSPYAIKDYYDVNPDLAVDVNKRLPEFDSLVKRTHKAKMKVIIDFVPNHVARNYVSDAKPKNIVDLGENDNKSVAFLSNNNFYYIVGEAFQVPAEYIALGEEKHATKNYFYAEKPAKATGNDVFSATPSINDWFETTKLNYGVDYLNNRTEYFDSIPDTWQKMYEILAYWTKKDVDGFRCDMAEMVPVAFWEWVIPKIKEVNAEIIFIAEIYNPDNYRNYIDKGKFDYLYDKVELYDTLKHIIQQKASTDDIPAVWQRQEGIGHNMLRFLENHDEQRIASRFFASNPWSAIPAMVLSTTMNTGPIMVYFGQEMGEPGLGIAGFSGDDGRTTIFDYWGVPEFQKWTNQGEFNGGGLSEDQKKLRNTYETILNLPHQYASISEGAFFDLHYFNRSQDYVGYSNKVYAYLRHHNNEVLMIVLNFNSESAEKANIKIPVHAFDVLGWDKTGSLKISSVSQAYNSTFSISEIMDTSSQSNLEVEIQPNGFEIFKITN
jgi:glycosidase